MIESRFQLPDPTALFDIRYFINNPLPFFQFAKVRTPHWKSNISQVGISSGVVSLQVSAFIKPQVHQDVGRQREIASQLHPKYRHIGAGIPFFSWVREYHIFEQAAGITRCLECHGSFRSATCYSCKAQFPGDEIRDSVMKEVGELKWTEHIHDTNITTGGTTLQALHWRVQCCEAWWVDPPSEFTCTSSFSVSDIVFFGEGLPSKFA